MENFKAYVTISKNNIENKDLVNVFYDFKKKYLYYVDNDNNKTVNILDLKTNTFKRDNDDIYLTIKFSLNKTTKNMMEVKSLNKNIQLNIKTLSLKKEKDKNIEIRYILENEEYLYKLERVI